MLTCVVSLIAGAMISAPMYAAERDLLIADFEGPDYGAWQATGTAFGPGPARGTLPGQMKVSGYEGRGLANSFRGGDGATGTLTSPPLKVQRRFINFLIGGGGHAGQTCINLCRQVEVVRTAAGPNTKPGGSEELAWHSWDVADLLGQEVTIQIVDQRTGGWGHINIDHIYQSDENASVELERNRTRSISVRKRYLNFPVKNDAPERLVHFCIGGKLVREFKIRLADREPDFWVYLDLADFQGRTAELWVDEAPRAGGGFDRAYQDDTFPGADELYREKLRPQFHFTSQRGWNNDSNGMMYYRGEYHLFWQHNPFGWHWGNMTWGHAVSPDMIHWTELGDAIHPDRLGTIYSGSGVVDEKNTAGFQKGDEKTLVCIYTSAGGTNPWSQGQPFTQSIAYSNDRGRTWTVYPGNPVLGHINGRNRDPKVIWHAPTNRWVMALYLDDHEMGFFTSSDLKQWEYQSRIKCFHECPELFELSVDGDPARRKWVLYGGSGDYLLGHFDGRQFHPDGGPVKFQHGNCFYASQTFSDIPASDGRRIQMAWGRVAMPGMPFNQMMLFPVTLTLRTTEEGVRMFAQPIREIETLHTATHTWQDLPLVPGRNPLEQIGGELFHLRVRLDPGQAREVGLTVRGVSIAYDVARRELTCLDRKAPLAPSGGKIALEVLVDRTSVEIFGNDGHVYMPIGVILQQDNQSLGVYAKEGPARVDVLEVHELRSAWPPATGEQWTRRLPNGEGGRTE